MHSQGILVVKRIDLNDSKAEELTPSGLSWGEVLQKYRGISGLPWPDDHELSIEIPESGLIEPNKWADFDQRP